MKNKEICQKCGIEFEDKNYNPKLPLAKRIYCNKCVNELWKKRKTEIKYKVKGGKK